MSHDTKKTAIENTRLEAKISNLRCELISGEDISHLVGEVRTFIETLGFDEKREKATKDVLVGILWDWYNFYTDHITDHLKEKKEWYKREKSGFKFEDISIILKRHGLKKSK